MSTTIILGILIPVGITSISHASKHHTVPFASMILYVLVFVPLFSIAFSLLISQWFRLTSITVSEGVIQGRSYLGRKNKILLSDITKLTRFRSNGIRAIVVHSKYHGKIYISDRTERLSELLAILAPHVGERPNQTMQRTADRPSA